MSQKHEQHRFELKPSGLEGLLFTVLLALILLAFMLYIALNYTGMLFYMTIPFFFLLGLWLFFYVPYKLFLYYSRSIDTIVFDEKGICVQNKRIEIYEYYPWSKITDLFVNKKDYDKKPEEVTFITIEKVQTISLTLYNTIFTTTEDLWYKIDTLYTQFGNPDSE